MNAVEFEAVAKDGRIEIPAEHARAIEGPVRVIVLYRAESGTEGRDELDELMDNPIHIPGFVPLTREEANERRYERS